tara:strand:+ start:49757 stop:50029 length:273 start_codon:yes stop_codon:yes gene_type:complete
MDFRELYCLCETVAQNVCDKVDDKDRIRIISDAFVMGANNSSIMQMVEEEMGNYTSNQYAYKKPPRKVEDVISVKSSAPPLQRTKSTIFK